MEHTGETSEMPNRYNFLQLVNVLVSIQEPVLADITPPLMDGGAEVGMVTNLIIEGMFNENIQTSSNFTDGWSATLNGPAEAILSGSQPGANKIRWTIGTNVAKLHTVTLSYDGLGGIEDLAGNPLAALGPIAVTNNVGNFTWSAGRNSMSFLILAAAID